MGGLERLHEVLVAPSGQGGWLLEAEGEVECLVDGTEQILAPQFLITLDEELDVGGHHVVVEGDEG